MDLTVSSVSGAADSVMGAAPSPTRSTTMDVPGNTVCVDDGVTELEAVVEGDDVDDGVTVTAAVDVEVVAGVIEEEDVLVELGDGAAPNVAEGVGNELGVDAEVLVEDAVPVCVGTGKTGAMDTPRKSVLAGACMIGVNAADADVGDDPGTNWTTTFPPVPSVPFPVQMYSTYSPFNSGSTNPVMARAPVIVAPVMPLAVMYVNLSAADHVLGRVYVEADPVNRLNPVEWPVLHTVPAFWIATSTDAAAVTKVLETNPVVLVGYGVPTLFLAAPEPTFTENRRPVGSHARPKVLVAQMEAGVTAGPDT